MKLLLKILLSFFLLILATLGTLYAIYINDIYQHIHDTLETRLSAATGTAVTIGDIKLLPPRTILVSSAVFRKKGDPGQVLARATDTTIAISLPELIKDKQLKTLITLRGLNINGLETHAVLKTISPEAETYKEAFDINRIDSVFVVDAMLSAKGFMLHDIVGNLELINGKLVSGKLIFITNEFKYFTSFTMPSARNRSHKLKIRSENLDIDTEFTIGPERIILHSLKGKYYVVELDINGEMIDPFTPDIAMSFGGTWEADMKDFSSLPGNVGTFCRRTPVEGKISSNIHFSGAGPDIKKYKLSSTVYASNIRLNKLRMAEFMTKVSLMNDMLHAPLLNGTFYDGTLSGSLTANLFQDNIPFTLRMTINNLDFEKMMKDLTSELSKVYGNLGFNLEMNGLIKNPVSWEGHGDLTVSNGNLGPMPVITPLLGDIYAYLQRFLPSSAQDKITDAYVDFDIRDRHIYTEDLTLLGKEIAITAEGSVGFDGSLDFVFQNEIRPRDPSEEKEWHEKLRDSIINFGKHIKRTKLRGTVSEPEWGI